ncbi:hypothetical protein [Fusibacter tunisiensis]|jgi:hypothetical protein|uniref:MotA/TolQ/ExbB proton channel domain-containing protein n=1 Tax=Fusibacter tunisiensis TaxID=1008308 RepID=A0ABS2MS41_9FIRM|nr:hypothetical protein [Fusibacter tunisiensis]MBM7562238.1 hypothetical protein [Fusibacter tunisiensis]
MIELLLRMNPIGQVIIVLILLVLLGTLVAMFKIKAKYVNLVYDVLDDANRKSRLFKFPVNNAVSDDFKTAVDLRITEINTPAIIDKNMQTFLSGTLIAERFVAKASGLMIILGLVGTFFGLTLSISELVNLLSSTNEAVVGDVNLITGGLLSSINGMSVAFATSLFGISASIVVNVLTILVGTSESRAQYISVAEEYLDNVLGHKTSDLTLIDESGRTPLEIAFEQLGERLSGDLQSVSEAMSYRLTVASNSMKDTAESIEKSLVLFDTSVKTFSENTRDFSEFNHQLKNNIQRMSLAFDDLTTDIRENKTQS